MDLFFYGILGTFVPIHRVHTGSNIKISCVCVLVCRVNLKLSLFHCCGDLSAGCQPFHLFTKIKLFALGSSQLYCPAPPSIVYI